MNAEIGLPTWGGKQVREQGEQSNLSLSQSGLQFKSDLFPVLHPHFKQADAIFFPRSTALLQESLSVAAGGTAETGRCAWDTLTPGH